jgi:glycosyltransferase involved in cell wall biosynthesis
MKPLVSVLMCVRDGERHVGEAIASALGQTVPPREVVVVDDGSTDGTADVVRSFDGRVQLITQPPLGVGPARNAALKASSGELLGYLDADDIWEPYKLELQLEAFARDPSLDLVFGHMRRFTDGVPENLSEPIPAVLGGSLLFRRSAAERVGAFPTDVRVGEFLDWIMRARDLGLRESLLPDVVLRRREHASNITRREQAPFGDFARVLKAGLDRRRGAA